MTLKFLTDSGTTVTRTKSIAAGGRLTVNIEQEDAALANAAVATTVVSSVPIVVERAQYWPGPASEWYEAHGADVSRRAEAACELARARLLQRDSAEERQRLAQCLPVYRAWGLAEPETVRALESIRLAAVASARP